MKHFLQKVRHRICSLTQTRQERRHALVGSAKRWKMKRDFQFRFLSDMGLKPYHYFLDIGCGTLRGGLPIIQYLKNGHYFGVDVREDALDEGRKELMEAGLARQNPTLMLSPDISQLKVNQKFDYILAFSVLIHMNDKILHDTLGFVRQHLSEDGLFCANVNIGKTKEGFWHGFPVVARTFEFYSQACVRNGLVANDLGPLKNLGHITNIESQDRQRMLKITKMA